MPTKTNADAAVAPIASATSAPKIEREARLQWVPIYRMQVSPLAQREINNAWVNKIAADFDLEELGTPTVNRRGDHWYVIDGQHRVEALKVIGWGDQQLQCWTYSGLTEAEEAEKFLKLNAKLTVNAFARFKVGVEAGRTEEGDIDRIVRAQGLRISTDKKSGSISAVGSLRRVYRQAGPGQLARALGIIRDAYGDAGLEAQVLSGIGLMCGRYDTALEDDRLRERLSAAHGGVNGLLNKADLINRSVGGPKFYCVAAAAVEIYNQGRTGKKLPSWWRSTDEV